jgi:hypothetical protein
MAARHKLKLFQKLQKCLLWGDDYVCIYAYIYESMNMPTYMCINAVIYDVYINK